MSQALKRDQAKRVADIKLANAILKGGTVARTNMALIKHQNQPVQVSQSYQAANPGYAYGSPVQAPFTRGQF